MGDSSILFFRVDQWLEIFVSLFLAIVAIVRYKKMSVSARALPWVIVPECVLNNLDDYFKAHNISVTPVLYVSYFKNLVLLSVFFNYCIPLFTKYKVGVYMTICGTLFWVVVVMFYKPGALPGIGPATLEVNDAAELAFMNYLAFFTLGCIAIALWALFVMFKNNSWELIRLDMNFWLLVVNVFMDSCGFINSIIMPLASIKDIYAHRALYNFVSFIIDWLPGYFGTVAFGIIFLIFPKKNTYAKQ